MKKAKEIKAAGYCIIRKDLQKKNSAVPIGHASYYSGSFPLLYRWLKDDEGFQVFYNFQWQDAESIDFDFLDTEKKIIVEHFRHYDYSSAMEEIKNDWQAKDLKNFVRLCGYKSNYCKDILICMVQDLARIHAWKLELTALNPFLNK